MVIDNCNHGDFIVVYVTIKNVGCPVCEMENQIKDLGDQIEDLEHQIAGLEDEIEYLTEVK